MATNEILQLINTCDLQEASNIKSIMEGLVSIIDSQQIKINQLEKSQATNNDQIIELDNEVADVKLRLLTMERYSSKCCLIFTNIDIHGVDPIDNIIALLQRHLNMDIAPSDLAACHPLNRNPIAPVIVKFIYNKQRDMVWRRKGMLKTFRNSVGHLVYVHERLTSVDRDIEN